MIDIFNAFTTQLDDTLVDGSEAIFKALSGEAVPFLALLIAVALAFYAMNMAIRGTFDVLGLLYFVTRSFIIYGLVAGGVYWTKYAYPFITDFGHTVGVQLFEAHPGNPPLLDDNFNAILDSFFKQITDAIDALYAQIEGGTIINAAEITGALAGVIAILFALAMVGLAFAVLSVAKFFLLLVLALAPLFLVWAYLGATKDIFDGWMKGVTRILIVQVLVYGTLGFLLASVYDVMSEIDSSIATLGGLPDQNKEILTKLWSITFIGMIGVLLMCAIPALSSAMAGGVISIGTTAQAYLTGALERGVVAAGRGTAAGARNLGERVGRGRTPGADVGNAGKAREAANDSAKERARKIVDRVRRSDRRRR